MRLAAILVACGAACLAAAHEQTAPKPVDDVDAYAVYAALLPGEWPVRVAKAKSLVIKEETSTYDQCVPSGRPMETDWKEILDDYRKQNATPRTVLPGRPLAIPYIVMPLAQFKSVMTWNPAEPSVVGWMLWYRKYPDSGGYIHVSAVGFDRTRRRALLYMGHSCNDLCGGGTYHFLQKTGDDWAEVRPSGVQNCGWAS